MIKGKLQLIYFGLQRTTRTCKKYITVSTPSAIITESSNMTVVKHHQKYRPRW